MLLVGGDGDPSFLGVSLFFFLLASFLGVSVGFLSFFSLCSGLTVGSVCFSFGGSSSGFDGGCVKLREGVVGVVALGAVKVSGVGEAVCSPCPLGVDATLSGVRGCA